MGAKHPSCGNPYYEYYQQLIRNNMEKKCTCGDTETQHYDDKCVVCGCKEFEEKETLLCYWYGVPIYRETVAREVLLEIVEHQQREIVDLKDTIKKL